MFAATRRDVGTNRHGNAPKASKREAEEGSGRRADEVRAVEIETEMFGA
ncbi:MAG TPA: hypothetical protein PLN33_02510 [Hyphomonadaceae bacterium]|jgi:hypothetical protein|nr:hypothetical protein [Hyphomonadaceae bacterium]